MAYYFNGDGAFDKEYGVPYDCDECGGDGYYDGHICLNCRGKGFIVYEDPNGTDEG